MDKEMRTAVTSPLTKTETLSGYIWTDEGDDLAIEIEIGSEAIATLFENCSFNITVYEYRVLGSTTTPKEIIELQVEEIIKEKFYGLSCEINYL
jgi:hypothetical protein